jgi:hypothetical protein
MSKPSYKSEVPVESLTTVAQTALSCGIGMLLAGKLRRNTQRSAALAVLTVGALSALPLLYEALSRRLRGPGTERGMRKTLESIRDDYGIADDLEVY